MTTSAPTLGQAIDRMVEALSTLDETARQTALYAVCMQLGLVSPQAGFASQSIASRVPREPLRAQESDIDGSRLSAAPAAAQRAERLIDIRTFKEQKKPASARQMACVVGFYLQELAPQEDRKETINATDLERYFKQAGYKLPTKMGQVLVDAKAAGYFDAAGRGEYKLNAVGYNLVSHGLAAQAE